MCNRMKQRFLAWFVCLGLLVGLVGCESAAPVSTSPATISTIVAATMRAITPKPAAATSVAPTLAPTASATAPAPTIIPATRINFLSGATTGVVSGPIFPGQTVSYVLQAAQGEPMLVHVDSAQSDVTVAVRTQGGTSLLGAAPRTTFWQGTLPQTEDYIITLYGGTAPEQFTLTVQIASRIKFAVGADALKISGVTNGGYNVAYTLFASKGQKIEIQAYAAGGTATLILWGYGDGKTYLAPAAGKSSFSFTVPETQDYIIEVVPQASKVLSFVIYAKIK